MTARRRLLTNRGCALMISVFAFVHQSAYAFTSDEIETFDNEPPIIKNLLERASILVGDDKDEDGAWKAAKLYCEAARYGSAEGDYRLGMLYMLGRGVTANREYAANLFGIAAMHGHFEAQKMLETVEITADNTPPCVLSEVSPEKPPKVEKSTGSEGSPAIDAYIATLPKSKRWVVDLVHKVAGWQNVDPKLVLSIITAESNFKVSAVSNADAHGLMQLIPATAERFNVKDAYNASQNVKGGVRYLRWLLSYYRGDVTLSVAAYNAGERAVDRYKGIPPYKETKAYVKKVLSLYEQTHHHYDVALTSESPILKAIRKKGKKA